MPETERLASLLQALLPGLDAAPAALLVYLAAALLLLALGAVASWWLRSLLGRWRRQGRAALAARGELAAADLLESAGYEILGRQVRSRWLLEVDGRSLVVELRVDYLVARGGEVFVADAKTGEFATSLRHPATRRQLLEYLLAYRAQGALLLDMNGQRIHHVKFPGLCG